MTSTDVVIVGAGMAGLMAANELIDKGLSVVVLEAADRAGGRTKRIETGGRVGDVGGQWIGVGHDVLLAQGERFGIATYQQYDAGKTVLQLRGKLAQFTGDVPKMPLLSLLELLKIRRRWDRDMRTVPADAPWSAAKADIWDGMTLESWILANVRTEAARAFARLVPRGAWAAEARQVSYLWFLDALRSAGGLDYLMAVRGGALDRKFDGGMQQIAQRLAERLGERLVLAAPVRSIEQMDHGARISTDKGIYEARFVVIAVPPAGASRIRFEPPLPAARDGLQQRTPMGAIIKAIVTYAEPFWRAKGFSGQVATDDDALGIVMDDSRDGGRGVLLAFFEGRHALEWSEKGREARRARVIQSLVRFFGPQAAEPLAYEDNDWLVEPYTHGYVGSMPPGTLTRFGPALRAPCGRIHWAGSETSTEWAGYIEGALRSGVRAAAEVYARSNE